MMELKNNYFCIFLTLSVLSLAVYCQNTYAQIASKNQIKGVFLYKITKFIRWENSANKAKLCFLEDKEDQAGEKISTTVSKLISKDSADFDVFEDVRLTDIKSCNMLFIGSRAEQNLQDILAIVDGQPIVTISDIDSFTRRGGMFGFTEENNNVTVELNFSNTNRSHININSALQEMIRVVK